MEKLKKLGERVLLTFVGAFVALYVTTILASGSLQAAGNLDLLDKAAVAGMAASAPLLAGLVGFNLGDPKSPSLLRPKKDEDEGEDK